MIFTNKKKHAVTLSESAHNFKWDKQKGVEIHERQNRCHDDSNYEMKS